MDGAGRDGGNVSFVEVVGKEVSAAAASVVAVVVVVCGSGGGLDAFASVSLCRAHCTSSFSFRLLVHN